MVRRRFLLLFLMVTFGSLSCLFWFRSPNRDVDSSKQAQPIPLPEISIKFDEGMDQPENEDSEIETHQVEPRLISKNGYEILQREIKELEEVTLPRIAKSIVAARTAGNELEYHGHVQAQAAARFRRGRLKSDLKASRIVDKSDFPAGIVAFGKIVTVLNLDDYSKERYELVGWGEEDFRGEILRILTTAPLAKEMTGKKVGEKFNVELPSGKTLRLQIIAIDDI